MATRDELKTLAQGLRAFADIIDPVQRRPEVQAGSARSMHIILSGVAAINDEQGRGANYYEITEIAARANIDPRGMAGYYTANAGLLEMRKDGRWITEKGRVRCCSLVRELELVGGEA